MRRAVAAPTIEFDLEPSVAELAPARRRLRDWLEASSVDAHFVDELLVVAGELLSNGIDATPAGGVPVHFVGRNDGSSIHFEVSNHAGGTETWSGERPDLEDPLRDRGRGLAIVEALTDTIAVNSLDGRTVVRCMRVLDQSRLA